MKGLKKTTFFFGESHTLHNVHDTLRHYKLHPGGECYPIQAGLLREGCIPHIFLMKFNCWHWHFFVLTLSRDPWHHFGYVKNWNKCFNLDNRCGIFCSQ